MTFLLGYNLKILFSEGELTFDGDGIKIWWWGSLLGGIFPGGGNEQIFDWWGGGDSPHPHTNRENPDKCKIR